ncbi:MULTISPECIES: MarR family winged helix-turn-helix transcriptional regulator [Variovorax]|jgi:DNA-binding MarR family transcriptional regulator|uniref:MarR family winged helix-turn-helix transcriptional regulator n=1 Tax=Variovorax TaxID=34072 RepID=UPI00089B4E61|nr:MULTISPECIES: MarR family winged helix-turn-helix transcriptional regulator [Variovorax]UVH55516.1 MarR family winged helix-turn-helix transcriptional regulator [Variovorax paradoxus]SDZ06303.1 transcriptional regulator, MarR family [Variovorax sp. YR634]SDZ65741.1 DNA-binding transcriptional regulator, MarR family [Variovorax sp. YR266]SET97161.1 DNA-binding transcriptional regulator, MarR family [Variovorax sp. OV084]SOD29334.1 transcriptional regulator, MarR family [Variovorax sp. YR752]
MDTPTKPRGCTSFKVRQLSRRLSQFYDAEVSKSGLKTTQYSLLSNLARLGPSRPVDLAGELKMTASTLSRNLQPLIVAGLVAQTAGADARSRLVHVTPEGEEKRREALAHWKTAQQKLNALLGVERVLALHLLIDESMELLGAEDVPDGDD